MKTEKYIPIIILLGLLSGCGSSYEEQRREAEARQLQSLREDSAALKVAILPTLDCLPLFVAAECQMFDSAVDIRLKPYTAQMDIDTALIRGRVEVGVSDLVRGERMIAQGTRLDYLTRTNAYWQLIGNRQSRITQLKHLDDRMMAMTRYSATDLLGDLAVDSAKLKTEYVFRIQVNDVYVRWKMLENNEMDALLLTEPQATQARLLKHHVLLDSRKENLWLGAILCQKGLEQDTARQRQMEALRKGFQRACDSINRFGVRHYGTVLARYAKIDDNVLRQLPDTLKYALEPPREQDLKVAREWLAKKNLDK